MVASRRTEKQKNICQGCQGVPYINGDRGEQGDSSTASAREHQGYGNEAQKGLWLWVYNRAKTHSNEIGIVWR